MILNTTGRIVEEEWQRTELLCAHLDINPYVIMPNHFHAIVVIHEKEPLVTDLTRQVPTGSNRQYSKPVRDSLSTIIASFKAAVTRRMSNVQDKDNQPIWQSRFYDHIIRNEQEFELISQYIQLNPELWDRDENNHAAKETIKGLRNLKSLLNSKTTISK
jgi:REP element-mobilizing transposase RayT